MLFKDEFNVTNPNDLPEPEILCIYINIYLKIEKLIIYTFLRCQKKNG